uniref:(California timema) hypothetical protein n=1 Tax=Timema californicum TaxID=61474 RepID=A0A7R9IY18_TIMCA|nr:unnamed protein product [Timema californicum]
MQEWLSWLSLAALVSIGLTDQEATLAVNTNKGVHVISDHFLSLTLDPEILLRGTTSLGAARTLNMAKGLAPAYLRLGGPDSNRYTFKMAPDPGEQTENYTITVPHWIVVNQFARDTGLDLVVCLNILQRDGDSWDPTDARGLVAFSDKMGYNPGWQLGYELQDLTDDISAIQLGRDVATLRELLSTFPRFQHSLVLGPDITKFRNTEDINFLKDYLHEAGSVLSGLTWHPHFNNQVNVTSDEMTGKSDSLDWDIDTLSKSTSRFASRKPLWIVESNGKRSDGTFKDALIWARRLGSAARLGAEVIMRQPSDQGLIHPEPDYWVSVLHKMLIGRSVLATQLSRGNKTHLHLYAHCANTVEHPCGTAGYELGAVALFGVNLMDNAVRVVVKAEAWGGQAEGEVHQYVVTAGVGGDPLRSRKVLLNGKPLELDSDGRLPVLSPSILRLDPSHTVTLPAYSIGFWVVPGAKARPCTSPPPPDPRVDHFHMAAVSGTQADLEGVEGESKKAKRKSYLKPKPILLTGGELDNATKEAGIAEISEDKGNLSEKLGERLVPKRFKRYTPSENGPYVIPGMEVNLFNPDHNGNKNRAHPHHKKRKEGDDSNKHKHRRKAGGNKGQGDDLTIIQASLFDPSRYHSSEEDYFGNPDLEEDEFPQGDVFLKTGKDSDEEGANNDYDYIDTEDDRPHPREKVDNDDESVVPDYEDGRYLYGPGEFFEPLKQPDVTTQHMNYGELWEADALNDVSMDEIPADHDLGTVVYEMHLEKAGNESKIANERTTPLGSQVIITSSENIEAEAVDEYHNDGASREKRNYHPHATYQTHNKENREQNIAHKIENLEIEKHGREVNKNKNVNSRNYQSHSDAKNVEKSPFDDSLQEDGDLIHKHTSKKPIPDHEDQSSNVRKTDRIKIINEPVHDEKNSNIYFENEDQEPEIKPSQNAKTKGKKIRIILVEDSSEQESSVSGQFDDIKLEKELTIDTQENTEKVKRAQESTINEYIEKEIQHLINAKINTKSSKNQTNSATTRTIRDDKNSKDDLSKGDETVRVRKSNADNDRRRHGKDVKTRQTPKQNDEMEYIKFVESEDPFNIKQIYEDTGLKEYHKSKDGKAKKEVTIKYVRSSKERENQEDLRKIGQRALPYDTDRSYLYSSDRASARHRLKKSSDESYTEDFIDTTQKYASEMRKVETPKSYDGQEEALIRKASSQTSKRVRNKREVFEQVNETLQNKTSHSDEDKEETSSSDKSNHFSKNILQADSEDILEPNVEYSNETSSYPEERKFTLSEESGPLTESSTLSSDENSFNNKKIKRTPESQIDPVYYFAFDENMNPTYELLLRNKRKKEQIDDIFIKKHVSLFEDDSQRYTQKEQLADASVIERTLEEKLPESPVTYGKEEAKQTLDEDNERSVRNLDMFQSSVEVKDSIPESQILFSETEVVQNNIGESNFDSSQFNGKDQSEFGMKNSDDKAMFEEQVDENQQVDLDGEEHQNKEDILTQVINETRTEEGSEAEPKTPSLVQPEDMDTLTNFESDTVANYNEDYHVANSEQVEYITTTSDQLGYSNKPDHINPSSMVNVDNEVSPIRKNREDMLDGKETFPNENDLNEMNRIALSIPNEKQSSSSVIEENPASEPPQTILTDNPLPIEEPEKLNSIDIIDDSNKEIGEIKDHTNLKRNEDGTQDQIKLDPPLDTVDKMEETTPIAQTQEKSPEDTKVDVLDSEIFKPFQNGPKGLTPTIQPIKRVPTVSYLKKREERINALKKHRENFMARLYGKDFGGVNKKREIINPGKQRQEAANKLTNINAFSDMFSKDGTTNNILTMKSSKPDIPGNKIFTGLELSQQLSSSEMGEERVSTNHDTVPPIISNLKLEPHDNETIQSQASLVDTIKSLPEGINKRMSNPEKMYQEKEMREKSDRFNYNDEPYTINLSDNNSGKGLLMENNQNIETSSDKIIEDDLDKQDHKQTQEFTLDGEHHSSGSKKVGRTLPLTEDEADYLFSFENMGDVFERIEREIFLSPDMFIEEDYNPSLVTARHEGSLHDTLPYRGGRQVYLMNRDGNEKWPDYAIEDDIFLTDQFSPYILEVDDRNLYEDDKIIMPTYEDDKIVMPTYDDDMLVMDDPKLYLGNDVFGLPGENSYQHNGAREHMNREVLKRFLQSLNKDEEEELENLMRTIKGKESESDVNNDDGGQHVNYRILDEDNDEKLALAISNQVRAPYRAKRSPTLQEFYDDLDEDILMFDDSGIADRIKKDTKNTHINPISDDDSDNPRINPKFNGKLFKVQDKSELSKIGDDRIFKNTQINDKMGDESRESRNNVGNENRGFYDDKMARESKGSFMKVEDYRKKLLSSDFIKPVMALFEDVDEDDEEDDIFNYIASDENLVHFKNKPHYPTSVDQLDESNSGAQIKKFEKEVIKEVADLTKVLRKDEALQGKPDGHVDFLIEQPSIAQRTSEEFKNNFQNAEILTSPESESENEKGSPKNEVKAETDPEKEFENNLKLIHSFPSVVLEDLVVKEPSGNNKEGNLVENNARYSRFESKADVTTDDGENTETNREKDSFTAQEESKGDITTTQDINKGTTVQSQPNGVLHKLFQTLANALVVLSSTAEDGKIEVRISPASVALLANALAVLSSTTEDGEIEVPISVGTRLGERMVSMSSTLVETVSINYEDFNESFLTCGTCLCMYDGSEHTPKLLPCSHTVCLHCLTRIAASQTRDTGSFRCPICRELINIPRGGVSALPPSFLVNQLLDLMSRQRREVIPKCSVHLNQELLFCETCDTVFCTLCTGGSHSTTATSGEHTIIPFSIAIKRMSEILLYKANECISKLSQAQDTVSQELRRLDLATEHCLDQVNRTFQEVSASVERRRQEMVSAVGQARDEKRKVLEEQLTLIEGEKTKVERECEGLQYQVEVRNITQRIACLGEKLDAASTLGEPRENAFLTCDFTHNESQSELEASLSRLGRVRTSTTFPSLCTAILLDSAVAQLETTAVLHTVDYHGDLRTTGGDPVSVEVIPMLGTSPQSQALSTNIEDCDDGTYNITFRPTSPGKYVMKVSVLERPIKDFPLFFDVTEHNNPVAVYGCRGSGKDEFLQPVAIAIDDEEGTVYVVDTGNSRIKELTSDLQFVKHIENEGLAGRSCTGIAVSSNGLVVVNWRTKTITELSHEGETISQFSHNAFQEPIDVAVDKSYGHILVADNGLSCVFVFDADGKILFQVGRRGSHRGCFNLISSVTVGHGGEIVVADSRIQVFSAKGDFIQQLFGEGKGKGRYGGVVVDGNNRIIATRSEKNRNYVQVLGLDDGSLVSTIDSHESKLKRPSGMAITSDRHVIVVDLGNNCIKKYSSTAEDGEIEVRISVR